LSTYNLLGYAAASLGSAVAGEVAAFRPLFGIFLAGSAVQVGCYLALQRGAPIARPSARLPSAPIIRRLAPLFAPGSFAGGFVIQSLIAYYFHSRFGLGLPALGKIFFVTQLLTAASLLLAARAARLFGLLNTMVFSHLASNGLLIGIAAAPTAGLAVALLF